MVVDLGRILIFRVVGAVAQVFISVFQIGFQLISVGEDMAIGGLGKQVGVPLAADVGIFVRQATDDTTRTAAFRLIIVEV